MQAERKKAQEAVEIAEEKSNKLDEREQKMKTAEFARENKF